MEAHILDLGEWGRRLNKQSDEKDILLDERKKELDIIREQKEKLQAQIEQDRDIIKNLEAEKTDNSRIISEQRTQVDTLYSQLNSANNRLAEIYGSDGWKLLNRYYQLKGKLLPENSARYKALKTFINTIRGKKSDLTRLASKQHSAFPAKSYVPIEFPQFELPAVSIVIPAYNGWDLTYKCLASIKENTFGVSYEVIIGDDASTDKTKDIGDYIKNITVIRNEKNLEFLHNCNHAATYARGKYILFLNNDTEVRPAWLSSMVDLMEKDESIGMVGSKLIYPNGKLQEAGAIIWRDGSGWNFGLNQDPSASEYNYVKEADYISGASIVVRTKLWQEIGGFDKRYTPAYCEDSDLAFEVRKHGYKVVYQPLSEVVHFEGYTHGTDKNEGIKGTEIKAYQKLNNEKFKEKWRETLSEEHFSNGENVFWARDRSRNRKTILVIDHYVPHFDKDAGSKTVFQYLKLFVSLNMNVKFIGDNFYRHEPYTSALQQLGIEVLYGSHYAANWKQWISDNHDKLDFILLNRPHVTIKYIDFIRDRTRAKILYYGHDLHFVRLDKQYKIENKRELLDEVEKWKQIEISIFDKADLILTPSEGERNFITELGINDSKIVAIKPYIFETLSDPIADFSGRKDILFVGGFTHLPNVDGVLWFVNEIWPLVRHQVPGAKFIIAGSNPPPEVNALAGDDIDVLGFISDEALRKLYSKIKIVVIPLRYGAGVKGKTVEAMYHGMPLVTTDFGVEGLPGDPSFLSPKNGPVVFAEEVIRLYNASNDELASLSSKQVQYIHDHFHFEVVKPELQAILSMHAEDTIDLTLTNEIR
jgi:GT2 family glycosyltransferase